MKINERNKLQIINKQNMIQRFIASLNLQEIKQSTKAIRILSEYTSQFTVTFFVGKKSCFIPTETVVFWKIISYYQIRKKPHS